MPSKYQFLEANSDENPYYQIQLPPQTYLIEAWGASGGGSRGGKGGYTSGVLRLDQTTTFYIYVGGQGSLDDEINATTPGGYNGGGMGSAGRYFGENYLKNGGSGGGATDIRTYADRWNDKISLESRILVAGGGGGACGDSWASGGHGGGLIGGTSGKRIASDCNGTISKGGSQIEGELGKGQDAYESKSTKICSYDGNGAGGGGYRGGQTNKDEISSAGGGGSSFISGYNGCLSLNISFGLGIIRGGNETFYSPTGTKETGHTGDGAVVISIFRGCHSEYISRPSRFTFVLISVLFFKN